MITRAVNYAKSLLLNNYDYSGFDIAAKAFDILNPDETGYAKANRFVDKFYLGFSERPSVKENLPSRNVSDRAVDDALLAVVEGLSEKEIEMFRLSHRILMASESILGNLLLEYIHTKARPYGWSVCWGNCLYGVDLCSEDGLMVHIRNKSTTEVSLNDRNRVGSRVKKWFRINARNGNLKWNDLNSVIGIDRLLCEEDFRAFVHSTVKGNPSCLYTGADEINAFKDLVREVL